MGPVVSLAVILAGCLVGRLPAGHSWPHMKPADGRRQAREPFGWPKPAKIEDEHEITEAAFISLALH